MKAITKFMMMSLMMVAMCTSFSSCSNDDDDDVEAGAIVGKWIEDPGYTSNENFALEFKASGEVIYREYKENTEQTRYGDEGTYTLKGKKLVITTNRESMDTDGGWNVRKLTSTTLTIADGNEDPDNVEVYTFTKVASYK